MGKNCASYTHVSFVPDGAAYYKGLKGGVNYHLPVKYVLFIDLKFIHYKLHLYCWKSVHENWNPSAMFYNCYLVFTWYIQLLVDT